MPLRHLLHLRLGGPPDGGDAPWAEKLLEFGVEVGGVLYTCDLFFQRAVAGDEEERGLSTVAAYDFEGPFDVPAREADERSCREVDRGETGLEAQLLQLHRHDARHSLLALDASLDLEHGVLPNAARAARVDPGEDDDLGEPARVVELEHRHRVAFARGVDPDGGREPPDPHHRPVSAGVEARDDGVDVIIEPMQHGT